MRETAFWFIDPTRLTVKAHRVRYGHFSDVHRGELSRDGRAAPKVVRNFGHS